MAVAVVLSLVGPTEPRAAAPASRDAGTLVEFSGNIIAADPREAMRAAAEEMSWELGKLR